MARIKTVFPAPMVCHIWANQPSASPRNASGNLYVSGGALYSYGSHFVIGAFLSTDTGRVLVWNTDSYSITTSKHQRLAAQALNGAQWTTRIRVPSLSADKLRDIPGLAASCMDKAADCFDSAFKARQRRPLYCREAREYMESARSLLLISKDKKTAGRIPSIENPEEMDKETIAAMRAAMGREKYLKQAADYLARARVTLADAEGSIDVFRTDGATYWSTGTRIESLAKDAQKQSEYAKRAYSNAKARIPADVSRIIKASAKILAEFSPIAEEEMRETQRRGILLSIADVEKAIFEYRHNRDDSRVRGLISDIRYHAEKIEFDKFPRDGFIQSLWPNNPATIGRIERALTRGKRIVAGFLMCNGYADAMQAMADYDSAIAAGARYIDVPNIGALNGAIYRGGQIGMLCALPGGYWYEKRNPMLARVRIITAEKIARVAAANAEKIQQWRDGARVYLPHDVPTMARVRGDVVETSKGATVPLDHAIRLVRIVKAAAARGGASYGTGEGPMVGHFRLSSVGADMSAVIGCHTFSADESLRAIALIEAAAGVGA